jgi:S-adenosylmethionine:tRNA ribosyltransferase-isomerase
MKPVSIPISAFDYFLPDEKIARHPLMSRSSSKLLQWKDSTISDHYFYHLPELLPSGSTLVFNNTKVIRARIVMQNINGARVEIFCLEPFEKSIEQGLQSKNQSTWVCYVGNKKKWKEDQLFLTLKELDLTLSAKISGQTDDAFTIEFEWNTEHRFGELLEVLGKIPLPPYLKREEELNDSSSYQTVYAQFEGSVAAPTAGLHFTDEILEKLNSSGIKNEFVTLHVGAGTFKPVKSEDAVSHSMHAEQISINRDTIKNLSETDGPIISVGTTSLRTLESLFWIAYKIKINGFSKTETLSQWEIYEIEEKNLPTFKSLMQELYLKMLNENKTTIEAFTSIMITPEYKIRTANGLITNFHQPKSTLLLLISAFCGNSWKKIYDHALNNDYRFLSYGDSSLLWRTI